MKNFFIVTTTINKPSEALIKYSKIKNAKLIVALDKNSKKFDLNNSIILSTSYQEKKYKKLSNLIGWNCIARRNFAILEAAERGAEIIALVDDDNIPLKNWGKNIIVNKEIKAAEIITDKQVFDPIGYTNYKKLWHRGYPLEMIHKRKYKKIKNKIITADVEASFWNGDPDIDAIARLIYKPNCNFKINKFPFFSKKISPFNSQNTFISRKILKDYFLFPGIGRMEDIWAAYYLTSKKYKVIYTKPSVLQIRNDHNLIKDFGQEILGYKNNIKLINALKKNPENIYNFLPIKTARAFDEWKKIISNF
jgi:hypothetical protein